MYLQKEHNDKNKYIDEEIKSSMKMLFIGADTNESDLFDILFRTDISLHAVKKELKYDFISQMSEDGYRYISNKLVLSESLSLLKSIKDFGVNYNIIRNKAYIERYSDKTFFMLLLDSTFSTYAFNYGYKYFNADDGVIYQIQPPSSFTIHTENNSTYNLNLENRTNIKIPIHSLIGKNGSGKTYLMNNIIKQSISSDIGIRSPGAVFSRMIVLSNTINDKCYRPANVTRNKTKLNNYHFVSITSEKYYNKIFPRGKKITLLSLLDKIQKRDSNKRGSFE